MSTKRRTLRRGGGGRLTPEAIAAWKRADAHALQAALGLAPWEVLPFPTELTALGCSSDEIPDPASSICRDLSLAKAVSLQRKFLNLAGWPECRHVYEENLADARAWESYCRNLVEHPEYGGQGTGADPESRRRALAEAQERVRWREELLSTLDDVRAAHHPQPVPA